MFSNNNRPSNTQKGPPYSTISTYSDSDDSDDDGQDDFIQAEIRQQRQIMKEQDQGLEMLGQSAERLSKISMGIHEELGHQNKMLNEMETDLEQATENLSMVTIKTKELIQKSGGKRNFIIILVLSLIVVVLLFLILYT